MHVKLLCNRRPIARKSALRTSACDAIKIAVFDESPLFRAGIVHVLNAEPGLEVVAASDAFNLGATPLPDVVILDSNIMMEKLDLARSISGLRSSVKILVLASSLDEEQFFAAFAAGARGYLLKRVNEPQLLEAVHALYRGEGYVSPSLAAIMLTEPSLAKRGKGASASLLAQLTYREGEIFKLLPAGLTNREIGRRLGVTENTIKRYFTRIFEKLHVRNRVEAAMLSRSHRTSHGTRESKQSIAVIAPLAYTPPLGGGDGKDSPAVRVGTIVGSAGMLDRQIRETTCIRDVKRV
jgi:two-component system, NarL family, nitrate/nitrite response regulator NarL